MRHNKNFNHLGRQAGHRKAMLSNMASSLILHKRIETTVAKAKAVKQFVEPLVTKSKEDTTHSRRIVFSYLKQKEAVTELFRTIAPKIADRPGGYTRILKTGFRLGDAADMCIIEFVDFNEAYTLGILPTAAEAKPKTRRSRGKKAADAAAEAAPATEGGEEKKAAKPAAKKATTTKKAATTAKKAPAKAAKVENNIYVQFSGMEFDTAAIEKAVKADYTAKNGKKDMKSVSIYIKPEDMKAYYVIDGIIGDVAL